jgi:O-antigen/teichoic acid export membrane protein
VTQRPIAISLTASLAIQGVNLLTGVLLARELGVNDRGELAAVILWPTIIAAAGSAGFIEAVTYQASIRRSPYHVVVGTSLLLVAAETVVLLLATAAAVPLALRDYDDAVVGTALLFLAFVPLNLLTVHMLAILNGAQRFKAFHGLRFAVIGASAVGLGALALAGSLEVRGAAVVYLAANLGTCAVATVLVLRPLDRLPRTERPLVRELVGFGLKSNVSNVSTLLNERLDQLVISAFLAPSQLGLYVVAVTFTSLSTLLGYSVSSVALPVVAGLEDPAERRAAAARYTRLTLLATGALAIPAALAAPALIDLVFGSDFDGAADVARILVLASALLATGRVLGSILKAVNRPLDAGAAELAGLAVTAVALAALLPAFELTGAAVASALAYLVTTAWLARRTALALGMPVAGLLVRR